MSYHASIAYASSAGALIVGVLSCSPGPNGELPGVSYPYPEPRETKSQSTQNRPKATWPQLEIAKSWPASTANRFVSWGHLGGRYKAQVHVSPQARTTYAKLVRGVSLPIDSTVVKFHYQGNQLGPVYVMTKTSDSNWSFFITDPQGTLIDSNPGALCQRCHAEAVSDSLFGPPRKIAQ